MFSLVVSLVVSAIVTLVVIRSMSLHAHLSSDADFSGPQKFHAGVVPRIGGVGLVSGAIAGVCAQMWNSPQRGSIGLMLLIAALPAFLSGLVEDLTKTQSPRRRLFFTALSAVLGFWLADAAVTHTDIPGLDWVVAFTAGALVVTVFVVSGVANAVNIIDGFNGLASMCVLLMLAAIAFIAREVGDHPVMVSALVGIGAVLGFFVWNYPAGLIFLGDGGAYFLGFWVAELGILLIHRNPQVSPLFPLMICMYPVFEVIFSMYRRKIVRGASVGVPDGVHLHSLIFRRLVRWGIGSKSTKHRTRRNSLTSPYLWTLCLTTIAPALLWWDSTPALGMCIVAFAILYIGLYWRIVNFRTPRWMVVRKEVRDVHHGPRR